MSRPHRILLAPALLCVFLLIGAGCTQGNANGANGTDSNSQGKQHDKSGSQDKNKHQDGATSQEGDVVAQLQKRYQTVVRHVLTSVVLVRTKHGLGSGVVYDEKGHIVTNAHVVGNADTMTVRFSNGGSSKARLVHSFAASDLAVLELTEDVDVEPAKFADSSDLRVGQIVLAMGNPLGLSGSVTQGIVSAVGRTVTEPPSKTSQGTSIRNMVQTSAAINPGNSGGALVNLQGEVVGIPTLAATDPQLGELAQGIGFAIPSNTVTRIADDIIAHGKVTDSDRARIGIRAITVTNRHGEAVGVGVAKVMSGGPADKAGLQQRDVILKLAGTRVRTTTQLQERLVNLKPGSEVEVVVRRDGKKHTIEVVLGEVH